MFVTTDGGLRDTGQGAPAPRQVPRDSMAFVMLAFACGQEDSPERVGVEGLRPHAERIFAEYAVRPR